MHSSSNKVSKTETDSNIVFVTNKVGKAKKDLFIGRKVKHFQEDLFVGWIVLHRLLGKILTMKPFVVSLSSCGVLLSLLLSVTNFAEDNYVDAQNVLRLGKDFDINDDGHTTTTTTVLPTNVALRSLQGNANGNSNGNANGNAK